MNDQNQFDASNLEEFEDSPRLRSNLNQQRVYFAICLILLLLLSLWIFLVIWDILRYILLYLMVILGKSAHLS